MTNTELERFLRRHKMTQSGAARELDIDPRSMRRYIANDAPIPRTVEYALRWIAQHAVR